jgi:hypothetical protein
MKFVDFRPWLANSSKAARLVNDVSFRHVFQRIWLIGEFSELLSEFCYELAASSTVRWDVGARFALQVASPSVVLSR